LKRALAARLAAPEPARRLDDIAHHLINLSSAASTSAARTAFQPIDERSARRRVRTQPLSKTRASPLLATARGPVGAPLLVFVGLRRRAPFAEAGDSGPHAGAATPWRFVRIAPR
jgi:hypothetical protein